MAFLLIFILIALQAYASLPEEYRLLNTYLRTKDSSVAYRILKEYPEAVFADDLRVMLARELVREGRREEAISLIHRVEPKNLTSDELREDYVRLWKELNLDKKTALLKAPALFKDFVWEVSLSTDEALMVAQELFRRRFYREVLSLLKDGDYSKVCLLLGLSHKALGDTEKALEVFETCPVEKAKVELSLLYFEKGQRERSEKLLSEISDRSLLSEALFRMGRKSLVSGAYEEAIKYFEGMETSYSREFNLGLTYYALRNYSKALEHFLNSAPLANTKEDRSASYFWAYKSAFALGMENSTQYLIKASNGAGFYSAVASRMLGVPVASKALKVVMEEDRRRGRVERIKAIWYAGFPQYARLEALKRNKEFSAGDLIALSKLDPYLAIRLAVKNYGYASLVYGAVAFPTPYSSLVERASQEYAVEPALIYGIMRQESLFDPYAVSVAKAMGLMQLIPSTARYVANKEGIRLKNIYDPETNIRLGTAYLRYLLDKWSGDLIRAIASYNAGPSKVRSWYPHEDDFLFIETIPISETRNYVKKVLYNYYVYSELLK